MKESHQHKNDVYLIKTYKSDKDYHESSAACSLVMFPNDYLALKTNELLQLQCILTWMPLEVSALRIDHLCMSHLIDSLSMTLLIKMCVFKRCSQLAY